MRGRRALLWVGVAAIAVIAAVAVFFVLQPSGEDTAAAAALAEVSDREDGGSPAVLVEREWGEGTLVLVGFGSAADRQLALVFTIDRGRGYRAASYTAERADPKDVVVGSLLVSNSQGGNGQPAWSAAYGELSDDRIVKVEVSWQEGEPATGEREGGAYLVVREGATDAVAARFFDKDGTEVATVPVDRSG